MSVRLSNHKWGKPTVSIADLPQIWEKKPRTVWVSLPFGLRMDDWARDGAGNAINHLDSAYDERAQFVE